jgi:uncharacterized membrane protein
MPGRRLTRLGATLWLLIGAASLTTGCSGEEEEGKPTASVCPTTQTLTYENFGQSFFDNYCQSCHGSTVTGADRKNAPTDHVFDTVQQIRQMHAHIDENAAAGPAAVNTEMPPEDPRPTEVERYALGEWLACGAP